MIWHPTKDAVRRLWSRRWVRRVSYALVAGATAFTLVPWLATRPAALRWAMGRINAVVMDETGLPLAIGWVEFHPALGSMVLHDVHLGGDFLTVARIEVQTDFWSLFGPTYHIHSLRLDHPHLRLTEAGLAAIKLKKHIRKGPLPQFHLDFFSLTGGEILVPEPIRGIPALRYQFDAKATGLGPNRVHVDLAGAQLAVKGPGGWEKGRLDLTGDVSEPAVKLQEAYLRLGESQVRLNGRYDVGTSKAPDQVEAHLTGVLNLAQAARWGGTPRPALTGSLDLAGTLAGSTRHPVWTLAADGQNLRPSQSTFLPGNLVLKSGGDLDHARLDQMRWSSPQGNLEAQGSWSHQAPIQATLQGTNLDIDALGRALRLQVFRGVRGTLKADIRGPKAGEPLERPDHWQASLQAALSQHGLAVGGLEASLNRGRVTLDRLKLDLDALKLDGAGWATLGPRGLVQLGGECQAEVGAGQVAETLRAWNMVDLDMEGSARAQAKVGWSRGTGLVLDGSCEVSQPRWHGARADSLQAKTVEIRGSDLWVKGIDLRKGEGRGGGDLWLTWGRTAPGQSQMDMCYTASQLPVAEGLKAADLGHLLLSGSGGGWVRIQGPFNHLVVNGVAQVESAEAYGIKVPAAISDFWMDLESRRMKLSDVRIAERPDLLGRGDLPPDGVLALTGQADMDFRRLTWWVDLRGRFDSKLLALPGPRIQSQVEARLLGPITSPFGPMDLPEGRITLNRGRIFFNDRSFEGLQGQASLERGRLEAYLGIEGMGRHLLDLQVHQEGPDLAGGLSLAISPDTANTDSLAQSLTGDLLEDLSLEAKAQGRWHQGNLAWSGSLDHLTARFNAFELHQAGPSELKGNALGAMVDIALEGGARQPAEQPAVQAAHMRFSGTVPFSTSAPMAIQVRGSADLAHLKAIMDRVMELDEYSLLSGLRVGGTSRFDILAHGSYANPAMDGTLSLDKGQMNLRGYQGVEDLQAEVVLKDRTVSIPEGKPIRGTLAHGDLEVTGALTWKLGGLDAYALKASLANFQLRDVPDGLDLRGSLQASLDGGEEGGLLKGKLYADRLSYQTEVKLADLILRSALSDSGGLTGLDLDDPLDRVRLDLDLDLRDPWNFDTNLLKLAGRTEGPFQVLGTLAHPVPKGILVFQPGGRVTNIFPAGDMVVDRGSLTFSESRPLDPYISLQGSVTSIPGYTVNLDIHGTLSNLTILPSSTPSLRQGEIVAILISPGNAANVGTSASSGATQSAITSGFAGGVSGLVSTLAFTPLQDQLRRTLGLDRVNVAIRPSGLGTTETEYTLGKSISLFGLRSAIVGSHIRNGELSITSGQVEWRFGNFILQLGFSQGGSTGLAPTGEIRHTWSPK